MGDMWIPCVVLELLSFIIFAVDDSVRFEFKKFLADKIMRLIRCLRVGAIRIAIQQSVTLPLIQRYYFTQQQSITDVTIKDLNAKTFCRDIFNDIPSELKKLDDDIYEIICDTQQKSGFIPTIFLILARRPDEFRAFFNYYDALMKKENSKLTNFEKEMIVVATSSFNKCLYCIVAHGAMLRVFAKKEENMDNYNMIADQIATDYKKADITNKQMIMLDYAVKLATEPWKVDQNDFDKLESVGFGKEEIWDIGAITALFAASNRIAHMSALMPNNEFYEIGRLKK